MRKNPGDLFVMVALTISISVSFAAAGAAAQGSDASPKPGALNFTTYQVTDPNFGGMRVSTMAIPAGWRASSQVRWDFSSANYPVRVHVRVQSPDGKMWIDLLPMDAVYWMDRTFQPIPVGQRSFGAVYAPNASIEQAMQQLVVLPARGKMPGFQITGKRPVDAARLAQAFGEGQLARRGHVDARALHAQWRAGRGGLLHVLHGGADDPVHRPARHEPRVPPHAAALACGGRHRRAAAFGVPAAGHGRRLDPARRELPAPYPVGAAAHHGAVQCRT